MEYHPVGSSCQRAEGPCPKPQWALYPQAWGNRGGGQATAETGDCGGASGEGGGKVREEGGHVPAWIPGVQG